MSIEDNAKEIFHQALDRPTGERGKFVDRLCGAGTPLGQRVARLLEMHAAMGGFLAEPATPVAEGPGSVLDRYKLLQQIGEGGFGVVYMAEQTAPVRRKVALKIIKLGMDTKQVIARFEAERQALALMDHPNIAKVLDAGATGTGRPYFVMELVRGVPITKYCDQAHLDTGGRLELLRQVCHAVQHAHQKGIIHRGLKPSNILVTLHDGRPVPKVIDFGVAKATDHRLTEKTLFTEFQQMIGTPEYMAPEQAELSGLDVDTRADIYSLGVLLYEVLTGTKPFDLSTLAEKGYGEILRTIREVDPPKPSTRVSTMGAELQAVAQSRGTKPSLLGRVMRGDLDWIVMKALEKDRTRRYETANALAMDIGRYLHDEPVLATPPAVTYRARKYVRRHRVGVVAALLVLVALVAGIVAALLGLMEARAEARRAETIQAFLLDMVSAADPELYNGPEYTVRQLLDDFDMRMKGQLATQPEVEATVRTAMGRAFVGLGIYDRADAHLDRALEIGRRALGPDHDVLADALRSKSRVLDERVDHAGAERVARDALAMRRRLHGAVHREVAKDMLVLAWSLESASRLDEAEALLHEALGVQRQALGERHEDIAEVLTALGYVRGQKADYDGAFRLYEEARGMYAGLLGSGHPKVTQTLTCICRIHATRGDFEAAERVARETVALARASLGNENPLTIEALRELGETLWREQSFDEAEEVLREALKLSRAVFGERHLRTGRVLGQLGSCLTEKGRYEAALGFLRDAESVLRETAPGGSDLAVILNDLGLAYRELSDHDRALRCYEEAFDINRRKLGEDHAETATLLCNIADLKWQSGQYAEAEPLYRRAIAIVRRAKGDTSPALVRAMNGFGQTLRHLGRMEEARTVTQEALDIARARFPGLVEHAAAANNMATLMERDEDALKFLQEATDALKDSDSGNRHLRQTKMNLAFVLHRLGRWEEAARLFLEVLPDIPVLQGALPEDHMRYQIAAVMTLVATARWTEAEAPARDLMDLEIRHRPEGHEEHDLCRLFLGAVLVQSGKFAEAEPLLRGLVRNLPEAGWLRPWARSLLGGSLAGQGKYEEAEPLLLDGYGKMIPPQSLAHHKRESFERVVRLYEAWGKPEKAAEWRAKLDAK